jgi:hypothetical protein
MSPFLLTLVTLLYAGVAISEAAKHNWSMVLVWFAYALANLGFIWGTL